MNNEQRAPEQRAAMTPLEDLRQAALKHYDEVTTAAHCWRSEIPKAINFYFDYLLQQPTSERCMCGHRCPSRYEREVEDAQCEHAPDCELMRGVATTGAGEGTSWCDSCKSYHPIPRDAAHKAELQCSAPATVVEGEPQVKNVLTDEDVDRFLQEQEHEPVDRAQLARVRQRFNEKVAMKTYTPPTAGAEEIVATQVGDCVIYEAKDGPVSTPVQPPAAPQDGTLRELALRIAEIHPPVVNGHWDGERSKVWVLQIIGLLSRHFPPTEATQVAVEAEDIERLQLELTSALNLIEARIAARVQEGVQRIRTEARANAIRDAVNAVNEVRERYASPELECAPCANALNEAMTALESLT